MDEVLVKGKDGKWYVLKDGELLLYENDDLENSNQKSKHIDLPKGVKPETYVKMETPKIHETEKVIVPPPPPAPISHEGHPLRTELDELIDEVLQQVTQMLPEVTSSYAADAVLQKRFRAIVSARLRDVRDSAETREMLMRSQKVGGLGLVGGKGTLEHGNMVTLIDAVVIIIERAFKEFRAKWLEVEQRKINEWKKRQVEKNARELQNQGDREKLDLDRRYAELTHKQALNQEAQPVVISSPAPELGAEFHSARDLLSQSKSHSMTRDFSPPKADRNDNFVIQNKQDVMVKIDKAKLLASIAPEQKPMVQEKPLVVSVVKKPELSKTPPVKKPEMLRPVSATQSAPVYSKITDVRPAPRLVGPIEELGTISLPDFRKIAQTPSSGVDKIFEKVMFLSKESLARRHEGVSAWRNSPLNRLYVDISNKALAQGVSPTVIIEQSKNNTAPTLTLEEFYAIMELNQKLRS